MGDGRVESAEVEDGDDGRGPEQRVEEHGAVGERGLDGVAAAPAFRSSSSERLLPKPTRRASSVVQIRSQPLVSTPTASAPAAARSTKPAATANTSTMTTRLSRNV